jgi:low temperature requirement protein LtrA
MSAPEEHGKRVSYVELYVDLVFVLAVGQLAHLVVAHPRMSHVWIALGLFVALWWTWIGFAVLYNRHGDDEHPLQRLLFLAGSVPAGVAAVAVEPASTGDSTVFVLSLAATRLILAAANYTSGRDLLSQRISGAYVAAAAVLVLSLAVPEPARYVLWGFAIVGIESGTLLHEDREAARRFRRDRQLAALAPADPREALDAHHFAERFSLFLIILLGEVVVQAGATREVGWWPLVAAMIFAAALWWLYFDAAAEINLKVLELSGGSPTLARQLFAVGHMLPAFALLMIAAGVGLLLGEDPPLLAYSLPAVALGVYLAGTRVFLAPTERLGVAARVVLLVATFMLGKLHGVLDANVYIWVLAAWTTGCAALAVGKLPQNQS